MSLYITQKTVPDFLNTPHDGFYHGDSVKKVEKKKENKAKKKLASTILGYPY